MKLISLLVLRNEGKTKEELMEFSEKFDTIVADISNKWLCLADISEVLKEEIDLDLDEYMIKP